ncbi:MAG: FAD-dependent oxidoreductase [Bacteroidales bacterium]|nr:FAD-dependent oxidoreductase [Bacteroidales bacterium]
MKKVAILGAGPAGIEAASILANMGLDVQLFERSSSPLKNIADKAFLFPNFASASDLTDAFSKKLLTEGISTHYDTNVTQLRRDGDGWRVEDEHGNMAYADAVLVATGYTPFDARRKEELGYGIYKGVVTSLEMEQMIRYNQIVNTMGERPSRVTFLQCVGSRDEKIGNHYCSKVCCVTAVKQAIEVKKQLPDAEIYCFYMDLRMWGQHFEEMYREAQEQYGIRFIRGRISEASGTFDGRIQIKAEDTLMGLPMKMNTDLLVLMVGMEASEGTRCIAKSVGLCGEYGFITSKDPHLNDNLTEQRGLYVAGSCKRPMSLNDVVMDARGAAFSIADGIFSPEERDGRLKRFRDFIEARRDALQDRIEERRERREERRENK